MSAPVSVVRTRRGVVTHRAALPPALITGPSILLAVTS